MVVEQPSPAGPPHATITTLQREASSQDTSVKPYLTTFVIVGVVCLLLAGYRNLSVKKQLTDIDSAIATSQQQYVTLQPVRDKLQSVRTASTALQQAYASQVSYSALLATLEKTTYSTASYTGVSLDAQGLVNLSGHAASYLDFAKVVKSFKEDNKDGTKAITDAVTIGSVNPNSSDLKGGVAFNISFRLRSDLVTVAQPALNPTGAQQ